ncbi:unnamed protein product, partial [Ixodes hexagonus]
RARSFPTARKTPPRLASPDRSQTLRPRSSGASRNGAASSGHRYRTTASPTPETPSRHTSGHHKARTGAALTEDVLAEWRAYAKKKRQDRPPVDDELKEPPSDPSPCAVTCSTCDTGARPTIQHLLWNCPGLEPIRTKHRGPSIASIEA